MAKRTVNIGSTANDGTGDQLRTAFDKLNQNNDEIYGANFVTEDMLNDNIVGADELKVTGNGAAGQILTSNADGSFSWATGVTGDITGVEAGDGLTGGGTGGDVTLNVAAGTGITVAADSVSLATTVQDEITVNTGKVGITTAQAADIVTNNGKLTDQTVVLTEGANVTITGTYPSFTIASDDVVGAVNSVNGDTGVVVLDTADIAENTNLYYTEARVTANAEVTANTAKTGITAQQASDIIDNNAKLTDQTVTLTDGGNVTITGTYPDFTIASADVVGAVTSVNGLDGVVTLDTADISEDTNLYYTEARVSANTDVAANTAKTGITSGQASEIAANTLKVGITTAQAGEIVDNNAKVTNATHTGDVTGDGALTIADNVVNATKLDVTGDGTAGQLLQSDGDGSMTWVTGVTGDVTAVAAGDGLTGGGTGGDLTLAVGAGDGITVAADTVSLAAGVAGDGLTLTTGVLDVNIATSQIEDNAVTSPKLALFDDNLAATDTHMLIANGTDFFNKAMSGDATIANTGAITIANDAVTADKLADAINTLISDNTAKLTNVTTDLSITGTTDARTIVSSDGTDAIIPVATASVSGLMSKTIFDEHEVNNAKAAGTVTNLTKTVSGTGFAINSSDGTNVDLSLADTDNWGLMSDEMFDAQVLNTAKLTNATHDGEVTGSGTLTIADGAVVADRLATDAVTTAKILNDNVTHDKLENRYTAINAIGTTSGAFNIDFSLGAVHTATLGGAHTGTFTNFKVGQVIDIIITGNHALTFGATASGTPAINKVGTTAYDGTATQIIQVQCASDDSTTPIFYYACNTYAVDTTP